MGIGNFFDNFISGLAFGMAINNPFFGGMRCCCGGFGYGGGFYSNRVDFETFANPFPNPFGNMNLTPSSQPISILNDFGNPGYPTFDFSIVGKTIWDNVSNPDSEYNKRMKEYYENLEKNNNSTNYCGQSYIQAYDMPFSSWYLPTQIPYNGYIPLYQTAGYTSLKPATKTSDNAKEAKETKDREVAAVQERSVSTVRTETVGSVKSEDNEPTETDADNFSKRGNNYTVASLKNKWSKKKDLPDAFYEKVIKISRKINCNPNDLMGVMWVESGKTFSPSAKNPNSSATGLIQFMPDTAKTLGTTIKKLRSMTAVEQLDYVEKFLVANKTAVGYKDNDFIDRGTLYSLVFLPGRSKRSVLTTRGENYYEQNKVLDYDKDGKITKTDLASVITDNMA